MLWIAPAEALAAALAVEPGWADGAVMDDVPRLVVSEEPWNLTVYGDLGSLYHPRQTQRTVHVLSTTDASSG